MRHSARRLPAALFACCAMFLVATAAAQGGAQSDINAPFVINPDVARWKKAFESEDREVYAKRNEILAATGARPGTVVADVGAGTGLFTLMFAKAVQPGGRVYAVDISQEFIESIRESAKARGLENVIGIVSKGTDSELPEASVDLVYTCDTYHHFEHPEQTLHALRRALRPGGRLVLIDYEIREELTSPMRARHVRADKATAIKEIEAAGFSLVEEKQLMRENYFVIFARP